MFFGYFLNTKKVTPSADFVIVPATAGAFLFSHTRLPLSPRPLLPFGRISPAAKPGWPVVASAGGNVLATPFSLCSNVAPRSHPGPCSRSVAFHLRRNRAYGYRPRLLGLPRKIARGISLRETTLADVLACPVYRTENALFCSCRVFQYLTMQVKAPFY